MINNALNILKLPIIFIILDGNKSITEIKIITVPEKANIRLLFSSLPIFGTNTSKEPKTVPNEAKTLNNRDIIIFILYTI